MRGGRGGEVNQILKTIEVSHCCTTKARSLPAFVCMELSLSWKGTSQRCSVAFGQNGVQQAWYLTWGVSRNALSRTRLFTVFLDLTKALNTVKRKSSWDVMDVQGNLWSWFSYSTTAAFVISNGVKQDCVLNPVLFNLFFTCTLSHFV